MDWLQMEKQLAIRLSLFKQIAPDFAQQSLFWFSFNNLLSYDVAKVWISDEKYLIHKESCSISINLSFRK